MAHGDAREGKLRGNWRMEWVASTLRTTSEHGVSPALLPLMRTPRLPILDWTDATPPPPDLNGLVRFAERRNLVSVRVPSHLERSLNLEASTSWSPEGLSRRLQGLLYPLFFTFLHFYLPTCSLTYLLTYLLKVRGKKWSWTIPMQYSNTVCVCVRFEPNSTWVDVTEALPHCFFV